MQHSHTPPITEKGEEKEEKNVKGPNNINNQHTRPKTLENRCQSRHINILILIGD